MVLSQVFERFVEASPVSVMVRGLLEKVLSPQKLDDLFERSTTTQYTRELLFSTVVEMMNAVSCGIRPSIHAAYQAKASNINVSVTSVYNKLNAMEPNISAELVRETASEMEAIIRHLNPNLPDWLAGYRVKILDGNVLSGSEHRLKPLSSCNSIPLSGQSLVVLDPVLMLAIDVFPIEDGHAQERSLLKEVLKTVEEDDVWIADRNFCTLSFLSGIAAQKGFFLIRQHQCLPWHNGEKFHEVGLIEGGKVFEQTITVSDDDGYLSKIRQVKIVLEQATRDGDKEIFIVTNLPVTEASAIVVAQLYRKRWTLETLFQILTVIFNCEIKTLGYPKAALFAFCVALVSYNILAVVLAALKSVHGTQKVEKEISSYYLADEIRGIYRGMMIAIPAQEWTIFAKMSLIELTAELKRLASLVNLTVFVCHPRSPKKTRRRFKRTPPTKRPHVSTAKILAKIQPKKRTP
ncbi:IS4 family transposase [Gloeothece verrucosa]|uniref:Transposase IS4 family protein n=1 Tax=Gloeothece verrucosa (strain PCC 7822) TaxID=497965 RepID=E0UFM5_GLOV7|nr:IS4 family transposase [Gloeothece verrucosa]ADN13136.1 transposase IS4 family protein [Gloeothece verrucosa PCC 7822]